MGQVKKALMEAECNAHLHPVFTAIVNNIKSRGAETLTPEADTDTVYGLFFKGEVESIYLHKDTAEYDCWLCNAYAQNTDNDGFYEVKPLSLHKHKYE